VEEQSPVNNSLLWDVTPYSPVEVHTKTYDSQVIAVTTSDPIRPSKLRQFTHRPISRPSTVAVQSNARNVFAFSKTRIMGSNLIGGINVYVFSVFVLSCVSSGLRLAVPPSRGHQLTLRFTAFTLILKLEKARRPNASKMEIK
jgi:hypothetical protein